MRLRPWHFHLAHPVLQASGARHPGVNERLELTGIQMTPDPLVRVVVQPDLLPADRTAPFGVLSMLHPDVHPVLHCIQLNTADKPRLSQPENLLIKLCVTHPVMLNSPPVATQKP